MHVAPLYILLTLNLFPLPSLSMVQLLLACPQLLALMVFLLPLVHLVLLAKAIVVILVLLIVPQVVNANLILKSVLMQKVLCQILTLGNNPAILRIPPTLVVAVLPFQA
ncbi:hypothetical protein PSYJA_08238 [Pseudomonas syringae pv. japonica str. M301072]|uniref:Uncharacterized protein n=1 Tax=Pseudomonas syringae pv. japonica str. M301072 TaxID=629262 RepID=F3FFG9_PSESX|nr:hypothetical protein PSYJA_08238 [Pseudomonas syringae pv. japonica str. M301072]